MSRLQRMYERLPTPLQHLAVSLYGVKYRRERFGKGYVEEVGAFLEREAMTRSEFDAWIGARLRTVLTIAADEVPHYRAMWTQAQKEAARRGELDPLPITEKEPLRVDPESFCRTHPSGTRCFRLLTSGSTGTPIATYWSPHDRRRSLALREARSARWAGVSFRSPRATFSGRIVVPGKQTRPPFHRYNAAERQVYFSAFHQRPANAHAYVDAMRRHKTEWLTGYAVSWYLLARWILDQGLRPPPLRAVITTSEKLTEPMREVMQAAYQCPVFEEYGTVENVMFASQCERGSLHVSPDAGIVEILRPDGTAAAPGEEGEVVATGLLRDFQLMIRYRLGDRATWAERPCDCGRHLPSLESVGGRNEDVVTTPDGRNLVRFHGLFVEQPHVVQAQVIQDARDHLTIKIVGDAQFGPADEASIRARVRDRLGPTMTCDVVRVDHIPTTPAGKYRAVINRVEAPGNAGDPAPPA